VSPDRDPTFEPSEITAPSRQFGKYLLLEKIGSGGMAEIFKAVVRGAADFQKVLVVKRVLVAFSKDPVFVKMFIDEARITAPLQHANIVSIHEFDQVDGQYYLAMEYVHGKDLHRVMARANKLGRRIPEDLALFAVGEVCGALWYAFNARDPYGNPLRIIHRDVSPSNILVSYGGEVKVADFGVAKAATSTSREAAGGALKGKLGYMSPEQVLGREVDHRSDIFALGIILFEALTLKRLFLGRTDLQTLINVRDADIEKRLARHPEIAPPVADILRKALAKSPDERFRSAHEMQGAIQDVLYSKGRRVGAADFSTFMRDLFPQESEQEILPLDVEDGDRKSGFIRRSPTAPGAPQERPRTPAPPDREDSRIRPFEAGSAPSFKVGVAPVSEGGSTVPGEESSSSPIALARPASDGGLAPDEPSVPGAPTRSQRLSEWTFRVRGSDGREFGPLPMSNFMSLVRSSAVSPDELCQVNDGEWVKVAEITAMRDVIEERAKETRPRVLLLEGAIRRVDTPALLVDITRGKCLNGQLLFKRGGTQKEVYFRDGRPRFLFSNQRHELLGEFLIRRNVLTRTQLDDAIRRGRTEGGKVGDMLVKLGFVQAHELASMLQWQFKERFLELFAWEDGWYGFFEGTSPPRGAVSFDLDPILAVVEAIRGFPAELIEEALVGDLDRSLLLVEGGRVSGVDLHLLPREMRVFNRMQSAPLLRELVASAQTPEARATTLNVVFLLLKTGVAQFKSLARSSPRNLRR
jgi:serine/threonine protein kinase